MAFSKNRRLADFIASDGTIPTGKFASGSITSAHIADTGITHADLHTNMDLTGKTVLVTTQGASDNDTSAASTAYVTTAISNLIDSAPGTLNTLNEIAAALNDDAAFNTTVTNAIAAKLPLAGGTMSGALNMGSQNITNAGTIASGTITSSGNIAAGNNGNINIPTVSSGNANMSFDGNNFTIVSNSSSANLKLQTNSQDTITIAANGNLTHHRGNTSFAGTVSMSSGHSTGRFSVLLGSVNGTYDFYNNGTSYLNGQTIIDDVLKVTHPSGWGEVHLNGPSGGDLIFQDNGVNYGEVYAGNGHGMVLKAHSGQSMYFLTDGNATPRGAITSAGKFAMGRSDAPQSNFVLQLKSISAGANDARTLFVEGFSSHTSIGSTGPTIALQNSDGSANTYTKLSFQTSSGMEAVSLNTQNIDTGNGYGDFVINTRSAGGYSEKVRVEAAGDVGIGVNNPAYRLDVLHSSTPIAQFKGATNAYFDLNDGTTNTRFQNSGGFYLGTTTNHDIHLKTNNQTKLSINTAGVATLDNSGEIIGNKWHGSHENIYWNSKLLNAASGYGYTPDKWFTQGAVTITSEHPHNKGFSTQYTNVQSASHTTNINNATPSTPMWFGVYTTFGGATNFSGAQNSSIGGGWENGEGAIMKMVYDGSGSATSTNAVRAKITKNFFTNGALQLRMSFFYFIESGQFSSGFFAGYNGYVGQTSQNFEDSAARHLFTNTGAWTYISHAARSYLGATYQQSSQNYMNGFGFTPGVASTVWIAIPGLTTNLRNDGKTINIASAAQQIGHS